MHKSKLWLITIGVVAFALGCYGGINGNEPVMTSSVGGASYGGGYGAEAGESSKNAVKARTKQGETLVVNPGESIQAAVERAQPGDSIRVMPGVYSETVYIDKDDIHLSGFIAAGERATLDGQGKLNDAILFSGKNIVIENFKIVHYKGNGIMVRQAQGQAHRALGVLWRLHP